jgi:hypothetical protein
MTSGGNMDQMESAGLPQTPHEAPIDRGRVDEAVNRVRSGAQVDLLEVMLDAVDWSAFGTERGDPLSLDAQGELKSFYRQKWSDVGPLFLAELLSTEFMTEQRARGDIVFSDQLLELGRTNSELWQEIRQFFRRKEMVTALLAAAHTPTPAASGTPEYDDEEDLWE